MNRHLLTSSVISIILAISPIQSLAGAIVVPGTSNPYLANAPDGTPASNGDYAPMQSPVLVTGVDLATTPWLSFSATGLVSHGSGPLFPPDGSNLLFGRNAERGISGYAGSLNELVGVFINSTSLGSIAPPAPLDFTKPGAKEFVALSPLLHQVFFIGDGENSLGEVQRFIVPTGASHFYLATSDGYGWFNNKGSFSVKVHQIPPITPPESPTPEPVTCVIFGSGLLLARFYRNRKGRIADFKNGGKQLV